MVDEVINAIKEVTGVDLMANTRKWDVVRARFLAVRCFIVLGFTQNEICRILRKDHSTISNAKIRFEDCYMTERLFKYQYDKICNLLQIK